ncbi:Spy0128 family protein [[Collinsella] massiliensis]|uniref:Spy0128 family protein n=1 Tax=[Collinsella] massiliensis TaxID=1232426 RepID=UPI0013A613CA|nr:FctA domain-containing protein [[Collinsella] massiliensis]
MTPNGTTINLFDYWLTTQNGADNSDPYGANNAGINDGHSLKFRQSGGNVSDGGTGRINGYTGGSQPNQGLVNNTLTDGYPTLSGAKGGTRNQSLAYLFNGEPVDGKAAYPNVSGLLQVDSDGYYYYNCKDNFASFDAATNSFTLYDKPAVEEGQFFPFNTAEQVFNEGRNGLQNKITDADNSVLNHYFGMTMSTRFIQSEGGLIDGNENKPVTYNFSGDDDVWVYIDGVLVGDLGGIHGATSLEINFATGDVYVYGDGNGNNEYDNARTDTLYQHTTIRACFEDAYNTQSPTGFNDNTFSDGSYHTLNFFYLERGNSASNMSLKYNLETIPESGVKKISQDNDPLGNVQFVLTPTDESYQPLANAQTINATTDWATGELVFSYTDEASGQDRPYTLEQLGNISRWWILQEDADSVPAGYRNAGTVEMRFSNAQQNDASKGAGMLLASNQWATGAYSQARVTVTAPDTLAVDGGGTHDVDKGTVFAVVMQKGADGEWYPVSGDAFTGWNVATTNDKAAIIAAAKANQNAFTVGSGGAYQVEIDNLPGDITTYEYVINTFGANDNNDPAKYSVKYYWTNADSLDALTDASTVDELDPSGNGTTGTSFDRVFSVMLNIPNIKNELSLVKTDAETKNPIEGVQFALYADENQDGQADDGTALSTMTTDENGTLQVYSSTDEQILAKGSYVLEETAPDGYVDETEPIQIVVDDEGVHVNAGTDTDNVTVETGIGRLVYSMKGFAAGDKVDATLHDVQAQPQSTASYSADADWQNVADTDPIHYHYNDEGDNELIYVGTTEGVDSYTAQAGWSRLDVTQCLEHDGAADTDKQDLGDTNLNALFTGNVTIHVTNRTIPEDATLDGAENLVVTKNLVGREWQDGDSFSFTLAADPDDDTTVKAVEDGTVVLPDNADDGTVVVSNETQGDPKTAAFGDIIFKSEGTYKFIITENDSDVAGVSKDASTKHVTVLVTDENGTLEANVVAEGTDELIFTNTADLTVSAADALQITKNLHASAETAGLVNAEAGAYQFTIKAVATEGDNQPTAADAAAKLGLTDDETELTADSAALTQGTGDNAYVWSGSSNPLTNDLTFTAADRGKTFTYEVSEVVPNPAADGYVYDTATHTVTYTVSADTAAALSVEVRIDGGDPVATDATPTVTFDNAIKVATIGGDGADTALKVQKTVNVDTDKDFAFDLTLASAKDGEGNNIDGAVFETGDDGALTAFDGMTATIDGAFNADNKLTQTASFDKITFTKPGTYTFNVEESTTGTGDGWIYDTDTKTIEVKVDNDMNVTVNPANATVSFTNTYGASGDLPLDGSGAIKLTKELTGRDWVDGDTFTFTLSGKNVTPGADETAGFELPATTEVTVSYADAVKAAGEGNATEGVAVPFSFGAIKFTQTGTYEFTVTEGDINEEHVSNMSGTSVTYRVVVEDNTQDGKLEVGAPVVTTQTGSSAFVNVYNPDAALAGLTATKTVNGLSQGISPDLFTFQIKAVSAPDGVTAPMPSNAQAAGDGTYTVTNDVDGAINFGTFRFAEPGTYTYTVSEVAGNQTGVTYDDSTFTVVYNVTDHPDTGALTAEMTVHEGDSADGTVVDSIVFANTYDPEDVTVDPTPDDASTGFSGTKTVTNEHGDYGAIADGDFQFTMKNIVVPTGVTAPEPSNGSTVDVQADGSFDFGTLTFSEPGTYTYEVREVSGNEDGVTYSDAVYTLSYTIEDQDGKLTVTDQSITNADGTAVDGTALNFENIYNDGQTEYTIGGTKVLETNGYQGASLTEGAYTFVLVDEEGNEVDRVTNGAATDNTATFQFDPITYNEAGTHTYTVYELGADGQPGTGGTDDARVTHSDAAYTVTVTVTASNDGRGLAASADVQNADITFTNTYEPTPVVVGPNGSAKIEGTKVLDVAEGNDRAMKAGEFEFLLLQNDQVVSRTTNDENGNFVFDDITFDKAGTYTYAVSEINTGLGGITYDSTVYTVTVEVTENADTHALEATVTYTDPTDISKPADAMTFTNSYKATGTTIVLGASKELKNGTLADGQFTFELTGSEGAPMPESTKVTNLADGSVSFGTVTFDKVGEYDYTITEVNDGQEGITYDEDATRTIHVSVTDSGEGYLTAYVTFGADGSHFVNTSTSTTVPGTGDGSGSGDALVGTGGFLLGATALVAIAGAGAVTAGAVMRRRKR